MFERLWVQILAPYTGWTLYCMFEKTKKKQKRGRSLVSFFQKDMKIEQKTVNHLFQAKQQGMRGFDCNGGTKTTLKKFFFGFRSNSHSSGHNNNTNGGGGGANNSSNSRDNEPSTSSPQQPPQQQQQQSTSSGSHSRRHHHHHHHHHSHAKDSAKD